MIKYTLNHNALFKMWKRFFVVLQHSYGDGIEDANDLN